MTGAAAATGSGGSELRTSRRRRRRPRPLRPRDQVLGLTAPGTSFLQRAPAGAKVAALAAVLGVVVIVREPVISLIVILCVIVLASAARISPRLLVVLLRRVWILLAAVLAAQLILNDPFTALEVMARILAGLLAAHLMILTTSTQELLGVFRLLAAPLRLLGVRPGRIVLAALVMLRAIPYLADQFHLAERQARARGLERNIRARVVPVLLAAVAYARDTARALTARGIEQID